MHLSRTQAVGAALLLTVIVAACGGSTSSPSGEASGAGGGASLEPTAAPSDQASGGAPTGGAVADLEALIPDEIGGIELTKRSMNGDQFVNSGTANQQQKDFLEDLGVTTDDVAVAFGFGASTETGQGVAVFVFRAIGAGSDRLISVFIDATDSSREVPLDWQPTRVSDKAVYRATDPEQNNQTIYLYAIDDTLFFLAATQEEDAAEALAALP
jgi:hypothetical protein